MLEIVYLLLEVIFLILMKFFEELFVFEVQEEFYDVIMFDDEEENEGEENGLVNKNQVCFSSYFLM